MRNRLTSLREMLSASYWFIPTVMAALAIALSVVTIKLDETIGRDLRWVMGLVYVDSPEGARAVLSTVASSMITVAGVVFSLTMVVLSLTSQQFGPLVLVHFMRDRGNQFVLGVFTSTFIFCLLILRTIHGGEDSVFVPHLSVLTGVGLSIISLAVLIYFIHHVSQSIQALNIIDRISEDLLEALHNLFPDEVGQDLSQSHEGNATRSILARFDQEALAVQTEKSGYLQVVDDAALLKTARTHHLVIQLDVLPGTFLLKGQLLVRVLPLEEASSTISDELQECFVLGNRRTQTQDVTFIVTQLSALAVRALSPGINDPYTAIIVIDHLGEALSSMLQRQSPSPYRFDDEDHLRVVAKGVTFETLFHAAFDQIRHYGLGDPQIVRRLLEVFNPLCECTNQPDHRTLLREYAHTLYEEAQQHLTAGEQHQLQRVYSDLTCIYQSALEGKRL